jgi:hypothetical protein
MIDKITLVHIKFYFYGETSVNGAFSAVGFFFGIVVLGDSDARSAQFDFHVLYFRLKSSHRH